MARILCIETSGKVCSVALFDNAQCIGHLEQRESFQHAAVLTVLIQRLLKSNNQEAKDLDCIALSAGPGSYTGLRIGTSVAKGLCYSLDIPLVAVPSLQIMANGLLKQQKLPQGGLVCPLIDARRMEVYFACYDQKLNQIEAPSPHIVNESSFESLFDKGTVCFVGNGVEKSKPLLVDGNARFYSDDVLSAQYMGEIAVSLWNEKKVESVAYFEPFYLKEFFMTGQKK
ncbi:MAG: tRNA (adenosine(37)-N6)-threonylcarbamoyltransferase complex dimerization subunit type 1 TsaB [Bacteroidia bacterium]|nr:tRNA (adenosine(37)-N6)-threonylcarbamoyltransferase complex dimerization subunit type 1 TsaB [Bacteroidia bacterium]